MMRKAIFQAMTEQLPSSNRVTVPLMTGYTLYYRTRPVFDSVKYLERQNRLTGYIKVSNLLAHGVNAEHYVGKAVTTTKGDIKLAALTDAQLTGLMKLIIKLASC